MKSKMPSEFYIFVSALALGAVCTLTCFMGTGLLSPALALSQSPALLAVCIMSLSFYSNKSRAAFLRASLFLFTLYFAFDLAVGNVLALLPLASAAALFFIVKDIAEKRRTAFAFSVASVVSAAASAVYAAFRTIPFFSQGADTPEAAIGEMLTGFFASKLSLIGYAAFSIVPIIFFTAVLVYITKTDK